MKKYCDIERIKPASAGTFEIGERIVVEEKLDFSNASIKFENGQLKCFSRNQELDGTKNTLNGFWNLVQFLDAKAFGSVFGDRYIVFGEWAGSPHKIEYPSEVAKHFWVFDIYDTKVEQYVPYELCKLLYDRWIKADSLADEKCPFVPVLYEGTFEGWEKLKDLVGVTKVGAKPCGEGIVIKRQSCLDSKSSRLPYYVKWVSDHFSEVQKTKVINPEKIKKAEVDKLLVSSVVTPRRIEKCLEKLIDEAVISADWNTSEMGLIAKTLPKMVFEDCRKEELETVLQVETFGKICGGLTMEFVKKLLAEKNKVI